MVVRIYQLAGQPELRRAFAAAFTRRTRLGGHVRAARIGLEDRGVPAPVAGVQVPGGDLLRTTKDQWDLA